MVGLPALEEDQVSNCQIHTRGGEDFIAGEFEYGT